MVRLSAIAAGFALNADRGGRIRTGDLLLPKQARYRAAPRPEKSCAAYTKTRPSHIGPGPDYRA